MPLRSFDDGRLFGESYGSGGNRVVALHGWGRDRRDFVGVLGGLDAVALDLPGFGATPVPVDPMGAAGYAAMIAPWIESLGEPQVMVGYSFGGRVATVLAAQRRDLVAGLVLVAAPLLRLADNEVRKVPLGYRLVRWGARVGLISADRLDREKQRRGSSDYRKASGVMRDILVMVVNESYEVELARVECPVRVVWGADDREVPLDVAYRSVDLLQGVEPGDVRLDVVPDCGHDVPAEAPRHIRQAIDDLL